MGEQTKIAWTDHTWNPWWGCERVSSACDFCYAESFAHRLGLDLWGKGTTRREFGDKHWNDPVRWNKKALAAGRKELVFCASMADVFERRDDLDGHRARLWKLIENTPALTWQLLTKRPENIHRMIPDEWLRNGCPPNVWLGTTVEDQRYHDIRLRRLLEIRCAVHFLSYEPALGPINFKLTCERDVFGEGRCSEHPVGCPRIDWVIVGGESGAHARPFNLDWARSVIEQCTAAGSAPFVKQLGTMWAAANGLGRTHGDDPDTWPEDLRVRRMPVGWSFYEGTLLV